MYIYVCVYNVCMCVYVCMCMYVCMYVCMMYVCICMYDVWIHQTIIDKKNDPLTL